MTAGRCGGILVLETPLHYIPSFAALGPAADAVERRKKPSPDLSPGGGFSCVWGPRWAVGQGPTVGLAPIGSSGWRSYVKARCKRPRRGLALASDRRSDTPPQRAYLCAPAARKAGKGPACGALAGGVQIAAPPQGQGLQQQPAAGAPARLGGRHPQRGAPGRYARPKGGAGGADGPTAPTLWGPGRPGAPAPRPARGRSNARPAEGGPVGAWPCIAEGCPRATAGGQLDRAGARRGPALAATLPRPAPAGGWTGRAAARRPGRAGVRPAGRWGRVGRPRGPDGSPHHRPQAVAPFPVARSSCQRWGPGVGSDAAADSGLAAECSSTGASMGAPALWSGG